MSFLLFLSDAMVPLMIFYIVGFGILSGRPVLDDFIRGVKESKIQSSHFGRFLVDVKSLPIVSVDAGVSRHVW